MLITLALFEQPPGVRDQNPLMKSTLVLLGLCTAFGVFGQGALTPPGPPAPTMKSLNDIEPRTPIPGGIVTTIFIISRSGSYYLTGNRTNTAAGSFGISVNANDVVIDLNGFTLSGAGVGQFGIYFQSRTNVTVLNGTVRDFTSVGIIAPISGNGHTISGVSVLNNGGIGIGMISSQGCRVMDCLVQNNAGGIGTSDGCLIARNRIISNGGTQYGIAVDSDCLITENVVTSRDTNAAHAWGITASGHGCRIVGNTVAYTSLIGIYTLGQSIIKGNYVSYSNLSTNATYGGIAVLNESAEVEDNVTFNCLAAGIAVHSGRSSVINNRIKSSPVGINFGGGAGTSYFANNRVSGATNAFAGTVPAGILNGGGNISF
jgi:parallel beta-helix repeat protein